MKYLKNVVTLKLDQTKCTGCGRCIEVCPREVLYLKDRKAYIADRDLCIECGGCVRNCEFGAITVDAGVGCANAIINSMRTGGEPVCECTGN